MCTHTRENPLTGSVYDTIGRSPRSFIPPCRGPFRFHFHPPACTASSYPPARTSDRRSTDPSASLRYPEPPRFHGRPRGLPHETTHTTVTKPPNSDRKGSRVERTGVTRDSPRVRLCRVQLLSPFSSNNVVFEARRVTGWNLLMRPCDRKCFRSAGSGTKRYDQSLRRDQQPRRHSLAPPEGRATRAIDILLPELPGCCDGPGVAITAPATPPPVPRRRHPSSYAPVPYLLFAPRWNSNSSL